MTRSTTACVLCLLSLGAAAFAAACGGHNDTTDPCMPIVNGVVIYNPGIDLVVRDGAGRGEAYGDTAITYQGSDSTITTGFDTLHMYPGFGNAGTFAVRVKRRFYRETIIPGIVVKSGICGGPVNTVVPVTLGLAPGAPPIRSIVVFGADFLYAPGVQSHVVARFDADPSVPTTVLWRLSDTTAARIDPAGVITARCTLAKGVLDTVTAIATVDTTLKARATFGVAQQTSCP